jgi:hypothetical protein
MLSAAYWAGAFFCSSGLATGFAGAAAAAGANASLTSGNSAKIALYFAIPALY